MNPFLPQGNSQVLSVTSTTTTTPIQVPTTANNINQVLIDNTTRDARDCWLAWGESTVAAVVPTAGNPANGMHIPAGFLGVFTFPPNTYFAAITSGSDTTSLYLTPGYGLLGVAQSRGNVAVSFGNVTLGANQSVNITQLGGVTLTPVKGAMPVSGPTDYEFVAASQTNTSLGATGAVGDNFDLLVIVPLNTSPGNVSVRDGNGSANNLFVGGASSIASQAPMTVPGPGVSVTGNWNVTTGANVSVMAKGEFT